MALVFYLYFIIFPRPAAKTDGRPKTGDGNTSVVGPRSSVPFSLRTFWWLAPSIILANALLGPPPKTLFFSLTGARTGLILSYRLIWTSSLVLLLISTCPPEELLLALQCALKPICLFKNLPVILALTLQLIPHFTSIRVSDLRHLPGAIAQRLTTAEQDIESGIIAPPISRLPSSRVPLLKPFDFLLLGPAAGFALLVIIIR